VDGEYYFAVRANKRDIDNNLLSVSIGTINLQIIEGETYQLRENEDGNAVGRFFFAYTSSYTSSDQYTGEITITKLDQVNQIVSGLFWFDIEHPYTNALVRVREGRFDMQYSQ
jgi:hypothetical protein